MKKPIFNEVERYLMRKNDTLAGALLNLEKARLHLRRERGRGPIGRFLFYLDQKVALRSANKKLKKDHKRQTIINDESFFH